MPKKKSVEKPSWYEQQRRAGTIKTVLLKLSIKQHEQLRIEAERNNRSHHAQLMTWLEPFIGRRILDA